MLRTRHSRTEVFIPDIKEYDSGRGGVGVENFGPGSRCLCQCLVGVLVSVTTLASLAQSVLDTNYLEIGWFVPYTGLQLSES